MPTLDVVPCLECTEGLVEVDHNKPSARDAVCLACGGTGEAMPAEPDWEDAR